jgi:hypothetical protein
MFCPECHTEYSEQLSECPDCRVLLEDGFPDPEASYESSGGSDLEVLVRTSISDPIAISLLKSLLREAGIPFFVMDQSTAARQESGNFIGWWSFRVPRNREAEAREILQSVEQAE